MRLTINFLMKKARMKSNGEIPVYVRFTLNSRRVELSTGIYCLSESWDEAGQRIKGRNESARILNNRLNKIEDDIQDHYNRLRSSGDQFDVTAIKNRLLNIDDSEGILKVFDYYLKNMSEKLGQGYSKETYKHYKSSRKRLGEFVKKFSKRKDYPVEKIDYKFLEAFDVYLKKTYKVHQNTAWNYHKHTRRVLNLAVSMDLIEKNPYKKYKVPLAETNRDFLTATELSTIQDKEITSSTSGYHPGYIRVCLLHGSLLLRHRETTQRSSSQRDRRKMTGYLLIELKRIIVAEYRYFPKQISS